MTTHIPKPGPRPGPRPGTQTAVKPTVAAVRVGSSDPSKFGRVDDDGSVWAIGLDGQQRQIASWQAGTAAEGLAHYGVRYDDLAAEVALLKARLATHPQEAASLKTTAEGIKEGLGEAKVIGDLPLLDRTLDEIIAECTIAAEKAAAAKQERLAAAIARKEELITQAEALGETTSEWKKAGDTMNALFDEWKTIRGIDRATDNKLWKRFAKARDNFNRKRGAYFAELDRTRGQVRRVKEDLVAQAEALQDSTDWSETARAFAGLMSQWKAAGRAQRDVDEKLWKRFKAAQDKFFDARTADLNQRDAEFQANADLKQALLDEYSPLIDPDNDLKVAQAKLRELQEKWEAVGYVPRDQMRSFESKIAALEKKVSDGVDAHWRRTDPEAQARVAQFVAKVEELSKAANVAEQKGKTAKAADLRQQAAQWQEWADAASQAVENR